MALPKEPVTMSAQQVAELNGKLSDMRHDINNYLSLIVAAMELIRHKPESAARMVATLGEQPARISESLKKFSTEFEKTFGITRP
jgi:hypothetical protein